MFKPRPVGTRENPLKDGTSNVLGTAGVGLRCNERHLDSDAVLSTKEMRIKCDNSVQNDAMDLLPKCVSQEIKLMPISVMRLVLDGK